MNTVLKTAVLTAAVAATTLVPVLEASAGERWAEQRPRYPHHRIDRTGDLVAAGVIGLAAGAIVAGALSNANRPEPAYVDPYDRPSGYYGDGYSRPSGYYVEPERRYYARRPQVVYAEPVYAGAEPWTPAWYEYCGRRYRSFDARSGTYVGYDGRQHFCVAN